MSEAWRSEKIRRPYEFVKPIAEYLRTRLAEQGFEVELGGSLRREAEMVGDIDLVVKCDSLTPNLMCLTPPELSTYVRWHRHGDKQAHGSILLPDQTELHVDMWAATEKEWGAFLWFITGPKELNIHMRTLAKRKGMQLDQFGLWRKFTDIPDFPLGQMDDGTEEGLARALGFGYIQPKDRQRWVELRAEGVQAVEWQVPGTLKKGADEKERPIYTVTKTADFWRCTCPHYVHRTVHCKHIVRVQTGEIS